MKTQLAYLLPLALAGTAACTGRIAPGGQDSGQSAATGTSSPPPAPPPPAPPPPEPPPVSGPSDVLARLPGRVSAITMDDAALYFACSDSAVYRLAKSGSQPLQRLAGTGTLVEGIAVDDESVYWTDLDDGVNGGTIFTVPKTGGAPVVLATNQQRPWGIAVDGTNVYWANEGQDQAGEPFGGGQIVSLPKGGGTPLVLVDGLQLADEIALDGDGVIWHDLYTVRRVPKGGGAVTTLDSRTNGFFTTNLVISGAQLYYWSGDGSGSFVGVPTNANDTAPPSSGPFGTVLAQGHEPVGIAVDGSSLFSIAGNGSTVAQVTQLDLTDGSQTIVDPSDPQSSPAGVVVDDVDGFLVDAHTIYAAEFWAAYDGTSTSVIRALPR